MCCVRPVLQVSFHSILGNEDGCFLRGILYETLYKYAAQNGCTRGDGALRVVLDLWVSCKVWARHDAIIILDVHPKRLASF